MKKMSTLLPGSFIVLGILMAGIPQARAFSFGSFNFSDSWGDGWGNDYRHYYNPRWDSYPPAGYRGYGWNNEPRWNRGFNGPHFNFSNRDGYGRYNNIGPRWRGYPPAGWVAPYRGFAPVFTNPQPPSGKAEPPSSK